MKQLKLKEGLESEPYKKEGYVKNTTEILILTFYFIIFDVDLFVGLKFHNSNIFK